MTKLLSVGTNAKTIKGDKEGKYLTAILYMSPHKQNGSKVNLCPNASDGCVKACLYTAGRGAFSNVQNARMAKADFFVKHRDRFLKQLHAEILRHSMSARLNGAVPAVRLNGTSDIMWERYIDMSLYPEVQFYDYTKWEPKDRSLALFKTPNYHLTFSRKETADDRWVKDTVGYMGHNNVAVVFRDKLPETYLGFPVIDGDKTDLRFTDPTGVIVGLKAKGMAKKDTSGFVVDV